MQHGTRVGQLVLLRRPFILFALFASASRATSTSRRWRHAPRHRRNAPRSLGHDGEMNGDFYKVVQAGKDCPYLEYVDPDNCPDVSYDSMLRCEDPCLCEAAWKSDFGRPAPSTRRASVAASARWRGDYTPSTRRRPRAFHTGWNPSMWTIEA